MRKLLVLIPVLTLLSGCGKDRNSASMVLHYDAPAEFFEEALPIGNGRLGAMVYGGTSTEKLSLNDITLWTGEPDKGQEHIDLAGSGLPVAGRLAEVRAALDREDYRAAEQLQKGLQGHFSESYQPLGNLIVNHTADAGAVSGYQRQLDLANATATVTYKRGGIQFKAEYFASAPDSVIVVSYESGAPMDLDIGFETQQKVLEASALVQGGIGVITTDGYTAWHAYPGYYKQGEGQFLYDPERGIHFRTVVSVCAEDGSVTAAEGKIMVRGATRLALKVVNATSFNGFDKDPVREGKDWRALASANAYKVQNTSVSSLYAAHVADYQRLFNTFELYLGETPDSVKALPTDVQLKRYTDLEEANPELEALYFQYGRYLLISSSRTRGVPANLQGLWNESADPPWSCNYTTNINLEENYWPAEASGLGELHEVLLDFLHNVSATGRNTAGTFYGATQGWCLGHNTDIWAMSCPVGLGSGDPCWANWNMGGAWLSTHIWEHWLYTRDKERLKKDLPVLLGAAEFCLDWLVEKDGVLLTSPSTSPENLYFTPDGFMGATLYGSTADAAIIRECLTDARLAAEEILASDGEEPALRSFIDRADAALAKLLPYKIGADGRLQEWCHDWADADPHHRHQSHLIGVYPGRQIVSGPLADAALKSLSGRGFETTGWSCGWRINLYARLGDVRNAYKMFRRLLRYVSPDGYSGADARRGGGTYPNLMDAHSPFQIDGNFGGAAGLLELFRRGLRLWPHGRVKGLRTGDGKTIDIQW